MRLILFLLAVFCTVNAQNDEEIDEFEKDDIVEFEPYYDFKLGGGEMEKGEERKEISDSGCIPTYLSKDIDTLCMSGNSDFSPCYAPANVKDLPGFGEEGIYYYSMEDTKGRFGLLKLDRGKILSSSNFEGFKKLQSLTMVNVGLTGMEKSPFDELPELLTLILDNNNLATIKKKTFRDLKKLTKLSLNTNGISAIDHEVFKDLPALKEFRFNSNKMQSVDLDMFTVLRESLEVLELANNEISRVTGKALGSEGIGVWKQTDVFTTMKHLNLSGNTLNKMHENIFLLMPNLESLNLSSNSINSFSSSAFAPLKKLRSLDLNNNKLTTLHKEWFTVLTTVVQDDHSVKVKLNGNDFHCSCDTLSFKEHLDTLRDDGKIPDEYVESLDAVCTSPENVKGLKMSEAAKIIKENPACKTVDPISGTSTSKDVGFRETDLERYLNSIAENASQCLAVEKTLDRVTIIIVISMLCVTAIIITCIIKSGTRASKNPHGRRQYVVANTTSRDKPQKYALDLNHLLYASDIANSASCNLNLPSIGAGNGAAPQPLPRRRLLQRPPDDRRSSPDGDDRVDEPKAANGNIPIRLRVFLFKLFIVILIVASFMIAVITVK